MYNFHKHILKIHFCLSLNIYEKIFTIINISKKKPKTTSIPKIFKI